MKKDAKVSKRGAKSPNPKQDSRSKALQGWITTVLGGIGVLYVRTGSLWLAVVGGIVALLATALFLAFNRK